MLSTNLKFVSNLPIMTLIALFINRNVLYKLIILEKFPTLLGFEFLNFNSRRSKYLSELK